LVDSACREAQREGPSSMNANARYAYQSAGLPTLPFQLPKSAASTYPFSSKSASIHWSESAESEQNQQAESGSGFNYHFQ
jgi:hypothetical protein